MAKGLSSTFQFAPKSGGCLSQRGRVTRIFCGASELPDIPVPETNCKHLEEIMAATAAFTDFERFRRNKFSQRERAEARSALLRIRNQCRAIALKA